MCLPCVQRSVASQPFHRNSGFFYKLRNSGSMGQSATQCSKTPLSIIKYLISRPAWPAGRQAHAVSTRSHGSTQDCTLSFVLALGVRSISEYALISTVPLHAKLVDMK